MFVRKKNIKKIYKNMITCLAPSACHRNQFFYKNKFYPPYSFTMWAITSGEIDSLQMENAYEIYIMFSHYNIIYVVGK